MTAENDEPPAALLTNAQRKLLTGEKEYRRPVANEMKRRIRRRAETALTTDFSLLADEYEIEDFVEDDPVPVPASALRDTLAFVILVAEASGLNAEMLVDDAVEQAKTTRAEVIRAKLEENPDDVTLGELRDLRDAGGIDDHDFQVALRRGAERGGFGAYLDPDDVSLDADLDDATNE